MHCIDLLLIVLCVDLLLTSGSILSFGWSSQHFGCSTCLVQWSNLLEMLHGMLGMRTLGLGSFYRSEFRRYGAVHQG